MAHDTLQELQLAGLSDLHGRLPDLTSSSSSMRSSSEELCGFGRLKYINMAGIIGDAGFGFTGVLIKAHASHIWLLRQPMKHVTCCFSVVPTNPSKTL
jgi:hypothetical protein